MKRFLVFTMCIMALVAFGCGGDSKKAAAPAKEPKTVQLAAAASLEKVFEQQLIPMFNKKSKFKVFMMLVASFSPK